MLTVFHCPSILPSVFSGHTELTVLCNTALLLAGKRSQTPACVVMIRVCPSLGQGSERRQTNRTDNLHKDHNRLQSLCGEHYPSPSPDNDGYVMLDI